MKKKANSPLRSWLVIALIAAVFFSMYRLNPNRAETRVLSQREFYTALEQNLVAEPIVRVIDRDEGETFLAGSRPAEYPVYKNDPCRIRLRAKSRGKNKAELREERMYQTNTHTCCAQKACEGR